MDPLNLATAAVAFVAPYLVEGGKEATKTAAKDVYTWLKGRLTGRAADALADLEQKPDSSDNQADLRKQLAKALQADPTLASELEAMLPESVRQGAAVQTIDQAGSTNAKAAQAHGDRNVTKIG